MRIFRFTALFTILFVGQEFAAAQTQKTGSATGTNRYRPLYAPQPEYPYEARRQGIEGSGVYQMIIDYNSGHVTKVNVLKSTGFSILDDSVVYALRQWRFEPRTFRHHVQMPLTFTTHGIPSRKVPKK